MTLSRISFVLRDVPLNELSPEERASSADELHDVIVENYRCEAAKFLADFNIGDLLTVRIEDTDGNRRDFEFRG